MNFARESTGLLQLDSHQSDAYCQYITSRRNKSPPESRKQSLSEIFGESDWFCDLFFYWFLLIFIDFYCLKWIKQLTLVNKQLSHH